MSPRSVTTSMLAAALALSACGGADGGSADGGRGEPRPAASEARSAGDPPAVLFLGTSLTAGYGVGPEQAFPALIQLRLQAEGFPHRVVNAGVSGETSAGALRRVEWLLRQPFDVLVLETGANDMLRGADLDSTRANLQAIVDRVRGARPDARIVVAGLRAPPNLGAAYAARFRAMYQELAARNDLPLVPFLLQGVAGRPELNLPDGIHPNAAGQRRLAENVWAVLEDEL